MPGWRTCAKGTTSTLQIAVVVRVVCSFGRGKEAAKAVLAPYLNKKKLLLDSSSHPLLDLVLGVIGTKGRPLDNGDGHDDGVSAGFVLLLEGFVEVHVPCRSSIAWEKPMVPLSVGDGIAMSFPFTKAPSWGL